MDEQVRVSVCRDLCRFIAEYIERNSAHSREIISKNIEILKTEPSCKIRGGYRFWKFNADKVLDLVMGYSIRIAPSGFLSYYGFLNRTAAVFESLYDEGSVCAAIESCEAENMINVSKFVDIHGSQADKAIIEEYKDECEIFRVGVESYALNLKSNIKFIIFHEELIDYVKIPKSYLTPIASRYSAIDVTSPSTIEMLRFKLKRLYEDKRSLSMQGLTYFMPRTRLEELSKPEPKKLIVGDVLTPAGNKILSFKLD